MIHNTIGTYRRFSSNKTAADIVQWDYGSWPDGLPKKDGANALSGAGSLDTATTRLSKTSRTKNLIIEYQYMVVPARIFPHCIVVHAQLRFGFLNALFNGPPDPTEPDKGAPGRARWSMTDIVRVHWGGPHRPLDHEPDGALRQALLPPCHALAGKRLLDGPLRPF